MRLILLLLTACATDDTGSPHTHVHPSTSDTGWEAEDCKTGRTWTEGEAASTEMLPGSDCLSCHATDGSGSAGAFAAAGTVYTGLHQPDDCDGVAGVVVEVTDATGSVYTTETNAAGNFFFLPADAPLAYPYTARLIVDGVEAARMGPSQPDGACNHCHTVGGAGSTPGRIWF